MNMGMGMDDECMDLPPGFRFHPTDEEIITHYLSPKVVNHNFTSRAIGEVDLNKCEPWDLPSKAKSKMGEKEWYFFWQKDRKYPTGMRTNRATEAGYWKATGKDKEVFTTNGNSNGNGRIVGMKKTLVFYTGRAPKGDKTNWVMHEYSLQPKSPKDEWVVCRVLHKKNGIAAKKSPMDPFQDHHLDFPLLMDYSRPSSSSYYFNNNVDMINANNSSSVPEAIDDFSNYCSRIENSNSGYLPQHYQGGPRQCKVEPLPNRSMISDDTGLSTDISSVVSRNDVFDNLDDLDSSACLDWDNMWKC